MTLPTQSIEAHAGTDPVTARSGDPIVGVRDVRKSFVQGGKAVDALRGANLAISEPGFYAVMGRSGSGKSTLLHLLAGLDRPDSGEILVGGAHVGSMPERDLVLYRRRTIGIVFQQFNLLPALDALGNVMLPGVLDGRPRTELEPRAHELLGELGLADRSHHRPEALSGGEQQRVAIARALLFDPPVVLADEPTGNLDSRSAESLWRLLRALAERRSLTVLMVTHEPAAAAHCRTVFLMRDGTVAETIETNGIDPTELALRAAEPGRAS
jgi:putative ABC transport system ATP-binding protein